MNILPVVGHQKGALIFWEKLLALGVKEDFKNPDYILVLGGDGTFLGAERDYYHLQKPFVGVGFGSINFLLNRAIKNPKDLLMRMQEKNWVNFAMHGMDAEITTDEKIEKGIAFNDIYVKSVDPTGVVELELITKEYSALNLKGDGMIIATPQGSTAYNRNAGGTILPLNSMLWCLTGICTAKPIHVAIEHQEIFVKIKRNNAVVVTDNKVFYGARELRITPSQFKAEVCFCGEENFEKRRYNE